MLAPPPRGSGGPWSQLDQVYQVHRRGPVPSEGDHTPPIQTEYLESCRESQYKYRWSPPCLQHELAGA
jgi:hypothetical protein